MNAFIKKSIVAFAIGLTVGTSLAHAQDHAANRKPASNDLPDPKPFSSKDIQKTSDVIFANTETFVVHRDAIENVKTEMAEKALEEDVDYAWLQTNTNPKAVNFVCYSLECHRWAKKNLHVLANAPKRPEDKDYRGAWKDKTLEQHKNRQLTEDEKIAERHKLSYTSVKQN